MKNRKELTGEKLAELEEVVMDEAIVKAIVDAAKSSMGKEFVTCRYFQSNSLTFVILKRVEGTSYYV